LNITITRALTRIKSIDKLLEKELSANQTPFVVAVKKDSKIAGFENKESYMTAVKARLQSINALINEKTKLKNAILKSNSVTKVIIAGKEYTVSDAIAMKEIIEKKNLLLGKLNGDYAQASFTMDKENERAKVSAENYIINIFGSDKTSNKNLADEIENATKAYMDRNSYSLCDPISIKNKINELEKEIIEFRGEVDLVLSESNAKTSIEV